MRRQVVSAALLLLLFTVGICTPAFAAIKVVSEPGADPAMLEDMQQTVNVFNSIMKEAMHVELSRDVRIFVCPTRESYAEVLKREFGHSQEFAERTVKVSGGMSGGARPVIAVNGAAANNAKSGAGRAMTTAHELFHQTQSQLSRDKKSKGLYWMSEGTADFMAAWVAEKRGFQSMDKWKLDRFNVLRQAKEHASPYEILHTDLTKWTGLMEKKLYPYEMSDLMVFYLVTNYGQINGLDKIAEYYRRLGAGAEDEAAFEQAFGVKTVDFVAGFHAWFIRSMSEESRIELIAEPGVTDALKDELERTVALSRRFFQEYWQADLNLGFRIVIVPDKAAYQAAMVREFGLSPEQAAEKAKNSLWYHSRGTAVLQASLMTPRPQRTFALASLLIRKFLEQNYPMASLDKANWLRHGLEDVATAGIVGMGGSSTLEEYRRDWLSYLAKHPGPTPAEMFTAKDWEAAGNKYGTTARRRAAATEVFTLVDKYGMGSMGGWLAKSKETGDGQKAYELCFGSSAGK